MEALVQRGGAPPAGGLRRLATALGASLASVGRWVQAAVAGLSRPLRGRPAKPRGEELCRSVREAILEVGGRTSVRQLRERFPDAARRVLEDESAAVRRQLRSARRRALGGVQCVRAGAVWAMDHTRLDGQPALCVRDLGSGRVLHSAIGPDGGAEHVAAVLADLFAEHGTPLAIKCDNGPAFVAALVRELLERWGVLPLYSPVRCPEYNGAVESGCRWLKEVAVDLAVLRGGVPGEWLAEAGRVLNAQRKRGAEESPDEQWANRVSIAPGERRRMARLVAGKRASVRQERGIAQGEVLGHARASAVDRCAIPAALITLGAMKVQRP